MTLKSRLSLRYSLLLRGNLAFRYMANFMILEIDSPNQDLLKIIVSAFAGAFFAFLLSILAYYYFQYREKRQKHKEALFQVDIVCNNLLIYIQGNLSEFKDLKIRYQRSINEKITIIPGNKPFKLLYDENLIIHLRNYELLNDYYSLGVKITTFNNDIEKLNESFEMFKSGLVNDTVTIETFMDTYQNLVSKIEKFENFLNALENIVLNLNAKVRILRLSKLSKIKQKVFSTKISKKKIENELVEMKKERETVKEKSRVFVSKVNK